ncbi:MAG: hypothetical protein JXC32_03005 [Anaerolineae bacterium]|nr:hypothetical protein [Anaerolineae bacterium]
MRNGREVSRVLGMLLVLATSLVWVSGVAALHDEVDLFEEDRAVYEADYVGRGPAAVEGVLSAAPGSRLGYEELRYEGLRPALGELGTEGDAVSANQVTLEFPNSWEHYEAYRFSGAGVYQKSQSAAFESVNVEFPMNALRYEESRYEEVRSVGEGQ